MIKYLSGLIIDKTDRSLTLLVGGVGYEVFATTDLVSEQKIDEKAHLHIHMSVKEDSITLFGFKKKEELAFYEKLLGVSGIGPKMGMDILATPIHLTQNAIISQDIAVLTKIKGLGKKTAERLCLELKNKLELNLETQTSQGEKATINEDAVLALESLGYERFQILKAMAKLPKEINETEEIVKHFLKSAI